MDMHTDTFQCSSCMTVHCFLGNGRKRFDKDKFKFLLGTESCLDLKQQEQSEPRGDLRNRAMGCRTSDDHNYNNLQKKEY